MNATSRASSKLLHGGLRYLENCEFRLVREALRERDAWIKRVPNLATPLRLVLPIYQHSRRPSWMVRLGLFLYDHLAGKSHPPKAIRLSAQEIIRREPTLNINGLQGGFEFSDGQMDDRALGLWVAEQAKHAGVEIAEQSEVETITSNGRVSFATGKVHKHDRIINIAGPWAQRLMQQSGIQTPYELGLVRGSHLILKQPCQQAYLLEAPNDSRIFFVLPWQGKTLVGTTEERQRLDEPIECSRKEQDYLLRAFSHYFPITQPEVSESFAGLRPLLRSAQDPNNATREYALHRTDKLVTVYGGKWTTAMALADKVVHAIH